MAETNEKSTASANKNAGDKSKLFREKNLERLESPEQLNDYLRVTSPGVWMIPCSEGSRPRRRPW